MIEYLENIDQQLVLAINGLHTPFFDELMWWISARITWFPLYIFLLYLIYRKFSLKIAFLFLVFVVLCVVIADTLSVYALKETVQRYRPTHNLLLKDKLHLYEISKGNFYAGGPYGFVSSHATNFFVILTSFFLVFRKFYPKVTYFLIFCSLLVCYSRIYLGVHYLSDVLCGAILGILVSLILYFVVWKKLKLI
jgi:undecaprenyl-diphosphatase